MTSLVYHADKTRIAPARSGKKKKQIKASDDLSDAIKLLLIFGFMTPIKIAAESLTVSTAGHDLAGAIICPIMQVRYVFSKAIVRPTTSP